jgi:hypothetical protein
MKETCPAGRRRAADVPSSAAIVWDLHYNDSSAVKASSLSARGMMSTKYRWAKRSPRNPQTQTTFFRNRKTEIVKQKTNTCIDAANAEYYVNGVYVKPQASCLPSTENQTSAKPRGFATTTTMRA